MSVLCCLHLRPSQREREFNSFSLPHAVVASKARGARDREGKIYTIETERRDREGERGRGKERGRQRGGRKGERERETERETGRHGERGGGERLLKL